jgi:pentatricopeptide repeat protein
MQRSPVAKRWLKRREARIIVVGLLSLARPLSAFYTAVNTETTALHRRPTNIHKTQKRPRPISLKKRNQPKEQTLFKPVRMSSIPNDGTFELDSFFHSDELNQMAQNVNRLLRQDDPRAAFQVLSDMIQFLETSNVRDRRDRRILSEVIDNSLQSFSRYTFAPPYQGHGAVLRIAIGVKALNLQLSSSVLENPYNTIPKPNLLNALKALTSIKGVKYSDSIEHVLRNTDASYRILQRLVTGNGVRFAKPSNLRILESDFNMVLNAYCSMGRMDMAHRVVALQKRTAHAPPLSAVAYSILLKGYGKLADLQNIDMLMSQAQSCQIQPDIVMLNSLINAYINCNEVDKAMKVFDFMRNPSDETSEFYSLFAHNNCPSPNKRTYNTILKGLTSSGLLQRSIDLSKEMVEKDMWDDVTTNTLVQAAVASGNFQYAEEILETQSERDTYTQEWDQHPNLEAYTSLIDGYGRAGLPDKALETLKTMESRGVDPNHITFSCAIGALAKNRKVKKAQNVLSYMKSVDVNPTDVTYNAFISGLLADTKKEDNVDQLVDDAISLLQDMLLARIKPNAITLATIINGFARCTDPRVREAETLVSKFQEKGIISKSDLRIASAMINIYGAVGDMKGALETFKSIDTPDVPLVNAFLDASSKCEKDKIVVETFDRYFRDGSAGLAPNLISFTILITAIARSEKQKASQIIGKLYEEMKMRSIQFDRVFVDT